MRQEFILSQSVFGTLYFGLTTIDQIRFWHIRKEYGKNDALNLKRPNLEFWRQRHKHIPEVFSECFPDESPNQLDTNWDGATISEASTWSTQHADCVRLEKLGFPKESWNGFLVARLKGQCGGVKYDAKNVDLYASKFRI